MATTINSMSVNLGMDASGFIDGSKISKKEAKELAKEIEAARTPTEELQRKMNALDKAYHEGAVSIEVYNRLMADYTEKSNAAAKAAEDRARAESMKGWESGIDKLSKLGNIVSGVRNGFDMVGSAISTANEYFQKFNDKAEALDAMKDRAQKLGLTFNELGSLEFAASRLGGQDAKDAIGAGIGQLLKRGQLQVGESAVDAFKRIADQVKNAANETERAQIATDAFGKSGIELLAVLREGSGEIGLLADQWERTSGLTQQQIEMIGEYNDRLEEIGNVVDGVATTFVAELAPAATVFVKEILRIEEPFKAAKEYASSIADFMVITAGAAKDAAPWIKNAIVSQLPGGGMFNSLMGSAPAEESAMLSAAASLWKERLDAKNKAIEEDKKREKSRFGESAQDYSDLIDGNLKEWDDFLKEKNRLEKQAEQDAERERQKIRDVALRDANKYFDEIEKRDKKIRDEVSKGPQQLEVGSQESARFQAEQINRQLASETVSQTVKPTDQQLLEKAAAQVQLAEQQAETDKAMIAKLDEAVKTFKENGFRKFE